MPAAIARSFRSRAKGLPGHVAALAYGREQPRRLAATALKLQLTLAQHGNLGGCRQWNHPLAATLALDAQQRGVGAFRELGRAAGQRHQLGHPEAGGIEHLEKAMQPRGAAALHHGLIRPVEGSGRHGQHAVDLVDGQHLGQGSTPLRRIEHQGRVLGAVPIGEEEFVELAYGRESPRGRGRLQATRIEIGEIAADETRVGIMWRSAAFLEKPGVVVEIPAIGRDRVGRRTTLGHDGVEEQIDEAGCGGRRHRLAVQPRRRHDLLHGARCHGHKSR